MLKICVAAAVLSCFTLKYCETASDKDLRKDVMILKKRRKDLKLDINNHQPWHPPYEGEYNHE